MDCAVFRERACTDPTSVSGELAQHEAECAACHAFGQRLRRAERLIHLALRFDPAAAGAAHRVSRATNRKLAWASLAAAFVGAAALWLSDTTSRPTSSERLVAGVLEHWDHEPQSWAVTNVALEAAVVERVLAGRATVDLARLGTVSYARTCRVAGQWMPHLVVQTDAGPVMLLLIPEQRVDTAITLALPEHGLGGSLRPLGGGSIAVLGRDTGSLAPLERRLDAAIGI